ncbi:MAG: chromate resistance protein [Desulfobacterales bacterium]|nr:chromate resistance protein [Desulfobacterales bacterium]
MPWIILIHQIPAKPTYFRAKIWRRLHKIGAVAIKQAVYVMPETEQSVEDLGWVAKEIMESGGEAVLLKGKLMEGLTNAQVIDLFQSARQTDYEKIMAQARELNKEIQANPKGDTVHAGFKIQLNKLKKQWMAVAAIDFFPTPTQTQVEERLSQLETLLRQSLEAKPLSKRRETNPRGKIWVTRSNVYVDRMASGWFIQRFIDPEAQFKFVPQNQYFPLEGEIRFDMVEAEYTHRGNCCTFEVLVDQFCPGNPGLVEMGKIIHDIDLKDEAHGLPETAGIHALFDAIVSMEEADPKRIEQIGIVLDGLLVNFSNRLGS